jgi:hypothetical protein
LFDGGSAYAHVVHVADLLRRLDVVAELVDGLLVEDALRDLFADRGRHAKGAVIRPRWLTLRSPFLIPRLEQQ